MTPEAADDFWDRVNSYPRGWRRLAALQKMLHLRLEKLTDAGRHPWSGTMTQLCGRYITSLEGRTASRQIARLEQAGVLARTKGKGPGRRWVYRLLQRCQPMDWDNPLGRSRRGSIPLPPANLKRGQFRAWNDYHLWAWLAENSEDGVWSGRISAIPSPMAVSSRWKSLSRLRHGGHIFTVCKAGSFKAEHSYKIGTEPPRPETI